MVIGGRVRSVGRGYIAPFRHQPVPQRASGEEIVHLGQPVVSLPQDMQLRAGKPYEDKYEDVVYRVVAPDLLMPHLGWATLEFWLGKYTCTPRAWWACVRKGLVDGALECNSPVKYYRVRDDAVVRAELARPKAPPIRVPGRRGR